MFLVILVGLIFPLPLAIHCLILNMLNRRSHPVVIAGTWDFAEVLFAVSGFLFFGGPAILAGFNQRYRDYLLYGGLRPMPKITDAISHLWIALWVGYYVIVLAFAAYMLWRRRRATSIYNIEADAFHESLAGVLDRLKLEWVRNGGTVFINAPGNPELVDRPNNLDAKRDMRRRLVIALDVFPAMRHVSMYWPDDAGALRSEIEDRMARAFAEVRTRNNPVAGWLLSIAGCLLSIMLFTVAAVGFAIYATLKT